MSGYTGYITNTALEIIREYDFSMPLHIWLKDKFRERRQLGARDRRWVRELLYCWYRSGNLLKQMPPEEKLVIAFYLCHDIPDGLARAVLADEPGALQQINMPLQEKMDLIAGTYPDFNEEDIFPVTEKLSTDIDLVSFRRSMMTQPLVWIRVIPGKKQAVKDQLMDAQVAVRDVEGENALGVPAGVSLDTLSAYQMGWFEVQDLSSQRTGQLYRPQPNSEWYDCCAASGGKSLLLMSMEPSVKLTVSDIRENILSNLGDRFRRQPFKPAKILTADLTESIPQELADKKFDGIIADVPCSGSGTWSRNPDQLYAFTKEKLQKYVGLQRAILKNVATLVKPGGALIYSTCSVFYEENEAAVEYAKELGFEAEEMRLFQGSEERADTLFGARLIKN